MRQVLFSISFLLLFVSGPLSAESNTVKIFASITSSDNDSLVISQLHKISQQLIGLDDDLGLISVNEALSRAKKTNDNRLLGKLNATAGVHFMNIGDYNESIKVLKNSLGMLDDTGNEMLKSEVMLKLGKAYLLSGQTDKSLLYLQSAKSEFTDISYPEGVVKAEYEIGLANLKKGNVESAIESFSNCNELARSIKSNKYILLSDIEAFTISLNQSNISDELKSDLIASLDFSKDAGLLPEESRLYTLLSKYYESVGNFDSAYAMINSSIVTANIYGAEQKEKLRTILSSIEPVQEKTSSISFFTILIYATITILVVIIFYMIVKFRRLKANHIKFIEKCTYEIHAFNSSITDLDTKIDEASGTRVKELDDELERAKQNKISLINSQNNLIEVNRLKDIFLSKISHEIRTPLSTIMGFAEILENQFAMLEENELFELARSITESGHSLVSLLNNILDISKLNSNDFELSIEKKDPGELIKSVIEKYHSEAEVKGLKIIHDVKKSPEIHTDGTVMAKIISSIVDNSIKFTEKGFIKVSLQYNEEEGRIIISVKDTGIGIDKVYLDQVFEPYRQESLGYSTSYQGAGLGLPLAKKMTTKLSGTITLESEKGSGTVVHIEFPISATEIPEEVSDSLPPKPEEQIVVEATTPEPPKKPELPWENLSILVVEDDSMNQLLFKKMLKKAKFLEIAKDGKTALSIIEKRDEEFDVVLMDINLPPPWTGITLQKEIRVKYPEFVKIPFIAQTAYAMSGNREQMLDEGFDEYINKPISKKILIDVINKVIR